MKMEMSAVSIHKKVKIKFENFVITVTTKIQLTTIYTTTSSAQNVTNSFLRLVDCTAYTIHWYTITYVYPPPTPLKNKLALHSLLLDYTYNLHRHTLSAILLFTFYCEQPDYILSFIMIGVCDIVVLYRKSFKKSCILLETQVVTHNNEDVIWSEY